MQLLKDIAIGIYYTLPDAVLIKRMPDSKSEYRIRSDLIPSMQKFRIDGGPL